MPRNFFIHSLYLLSAVILTWFWTSHPSLSTYNLQLIGLFILLYFLSHFLSHSTPLTMAVDAIIFTVVILLLVSSTGSLASPLFFLIYFLLFAVSLLFEPLITVILTAALVIFFSNSLVGENNLNGIVQIFSIFFIAPLAIFIGRQYLKVLEAREEIKILKKTGKKLERSLTLEETDSLLWLSLNFKEGLLQISHLSADLLSAIGKLNLKQQESLEKIHNLAKDLLKSGGKLKEKIDRETDEK